MPTPEISDSFLDTLAKSSSDYHQDKNVPNIKSHDWTLSKSTGSEDNRASLPICEHCGEEMRQGSYTYYCPNDNCPAKH